MNSLRSLSSVLMVIGLAATSRAQAPTAAAEDSVHRLVQHFYDWYLPQFLHPRGRDMLMEAATHGPLPFDAELVRWLRIDSTARARAKGEVDGLDGDPYINAQDPCDSYSVRSVRAQGPFMIVEVLGHGGCATHLRPDVLVEVASRNGRWTVIDFLDPHSGNEGLIPLLKRLHPKSK